jgi:Ca-activated chloride channel homolog
MRFPLEFGQPWALLLLLLLAPMGYLAWTTRAPLRSGRWWLSTLLRVALVLAVVAALADARWSRRTDRMCVFFLVDGSRSCGTRALEHAEKQIAAEVQRMRSGGLVLDEADDRFGVILFGQRPRLRHAMGPKASFDLSPLDPEIADFTNIGRAIRYAVNQFPSNSQKRIVLLTDGNENLGDAVEAARAAAAGDVDILAIPLAATHEAEVLIDEVIVPQRVRPHQPIDLRANIRSTVATDVTIRVFRDGEALASGAVSLKPGPNVIRLATDAVDEPRFCRYEVIVEPPAGVDTITSNNTGLAYAQVYGDARVLYLEGFPEHATRLARALRTSAGRARGGFSLTVGTEADMPQTLAEMAAYDCIILSDIPATNMTAELMHAVKSYVADLGGGLVMIGGERSLTTGGYAKTEIEEALPVSLQLEREKHLASLAMVIVVDNSGSMGMTTPSGKTKMQLANEACVEAIALLMSRDEAAVCVVDTAPKWVEGKLRPMTRPNRERLADAVRSARAGGGGIYCLTGLTHAYDELRGSKAQTRHVILFADAADSEQQNGCASLAAEHRRKYGITTTTVGLGTWSDPDVAFLKSLAENHGGGRFYLTNDPSLLPEIFTKDTYIVSRNALVEVPEGFKPAQQKVAQIIEHIDWAAAPPLYGYVATLPTKPKSEILLAAKDDEPLLARWRFGLGKSTVFTSDAKDRWAKDWATWSEFDRFWSQVVRWTMRQTRRGNVTTQVVTDGRGHRILVDALDGDGRFINGKLLTARVVSGDRNVEPQTVTLQQIGPGRYEGQFDITTSGVAYQVVILDHDEGKSIIVDTAGAVLSYPPEYRNIEPDTALLSRLAEITEGRYMERPAKVFQRKSEPVRAMQGIWTALLVAAVALLVVDIAARRLVLPDWLLRGKDDARRKVIQGAQAVTTRLRDTRRQWQEQQEQSENLPDGDSPAATPEALTQDLLQRRQPAAGSDTFGELLDEPPAEMPADDHGAERQTSRPDDAPDADENLSATERLLRARRRARGDRDDM